MKKITTERGLFPFPATIKLEFSTIYLVLVDLVVNSRMILTSLACYEDFSVKRTYLLEWIPVLPGLSKLHDIGYHLILPRNPPYHHVFLSTHSSYWDLFTLRVGLNLRRPQIRCETRGWHYYSVGVAWCHPLNFPVMIQLLGWGHMFALRELKKTESTRVVVNKWVCRIY